MVTKIKNKYFPAQRANFQSPIDSGPLDPLATKPVANEIPSRLQDPLNTIRVEQPDRAADIPVDDTTYNPYFDTNGIQRGSAVQQSLVQSMHAESIQQQGLTVTYYPYQTGNIDAIWNEDPTISFPNSFEVDMYLETYEGFEGDGKLLTQYGVQFRDQVTFMLAINTWKSRRDNYLTIQGALANLTTTSEPREGDLISVPFGLNAINPEVYSPKLFQINNVTTFRNGAFFQLGNVYIYRLTGYLYERSAEDIIGTDPNTGTAKDASASLIQQGINDSDIAENLIRYDDNPNFGDYETGDRVIYNDDTYTVEDPGSANTGDRTPDQEDSGFVFDTTPQPPENTGQFIQILSDGTELLTPARLVIADALDSQGNTVPNNYQVNIPNTMFTNKRIEGINNIVHFTNNTDTTPINILNVNDFVLERDISTGLPTGIITFAVDPTRNIQPNQQGTFLEVGVTLGSVSDDVTLTSNILSEDPFAQNEAFESEDDEIAVDDFTQIRWEKEPGAFK